MSREFELGVRSDGSLSDDFYEHALSPPAIKLAVKNLLPSTKVESAVRDGDDDFASKNLSFDVSVGIVFARVVVAIAADGFMGGLLFEPLSKVMMKPRLIVIDKNRRGDVHRVHKTEPVHNAAFPHTGFHLRGNIQKRQAFWNLKKKLFSEMTHRA